MRRLLPFIIISISAMFVGCENPTLPPSGFAAKAVLSEQTLLVGDVVTLTLTAHHPSGSLVVFPPIDDGKEISVRGRSTDTSVLSNDIQETEVIYQLTAMRVGNWLITTNSVVCTLSDGSKIAKALPNLILNVESSLSKGDLETLSDIQGPITQISKLVWVVLLVLGIALAVGLTTLFFMKKTNMVANVEPVIPPHVKAREALAILKKEAWVPEPFFVHLSLILRTYLEDLFDLNAPESTTEEMAAKLNSDPRLNIENREILQQFFTQADLVKFARAGAEQDVMRTAFSTIETFIEQTHSINTRDTDEIC